jgi:hypothetical protein
VRRRVPSLCLSQRAAAATAVREKLFPPHPIHPPPFLFLSCLSVVGSRCPTAVTAGAAVAALLAASIPVSSEAGIVHGSRTSEAAVVLRPPRIRLGLVRRKITNPKLLRIVLVIAVKGPIHDDPVLQRVNERGGVGRGCE